MNTHTLLHNTSIKWKLFLAKSVNEITKKTVMPNRTHADRHSFNIRKSSCSAAEIACITSQQHGFDSASVHMLCRSVADDSAGWSAADDLSD